MKIQAIKVRREGVEIKYRRDGRNRAVLIELPDAPFGTAVAALSGPAAATKQLPAEYKKRIALKSLALAKKQKNECAKLAFTVGGFATTDKAATENFPPLWFDNEPRSDGGFKRMAMLPAMRQAVDSVLVEAARLVEATLDGGSGKGGAA